MSERDPLARVVLWIVGLAIVGLALAIVVDLLIGRFM
jgi:hypothetical protein